MQTFVKPPLPGSKTDILLTFQSPTCLTSGLRFCQTVNPKLSNLNPYDQPAIEQTTKSDEKQKSGKTGSGEGVTGQMEARDGSEGLIAARAHSYQPSVRKYAFLPSPIGPCWVSGLRGPAHSELR